MRKQGNTNKLYSDSTIRQHASVFFNHVSNASSKSQAENLEAIQSFNFAMHGGKFFITSPEVIRSLTNLVQSCTKKLGSKSGHEIDIERVAWDIASKMDPNNIDQAVKDFTAKVDQQSETEFIFIAPNFVIELLDNIKELQVGPVKIRMSQTLPNDYVKQGDRINWSFILSSSPTTSLDSNGLNIFYPPFCWEVRLNTSPSNVEEEAFWLINIAISCIRLSYPGNHKNPFYPMWGKKEAHPTLAPVIYNPRIIIRTQDRNVNAGGGSMPVLYTVDNNTLEHFKKIDFDKFSNTIFNYKKNTVAERVAHGMGWLTRGRHAEDRSERLLFFYTAIEALVSSGDKSAPVIQTIARNAATILDDRPERRRDIAKDIIESYEYRSSLVHGGRRQVSYTESYKAQRLAESLYDAVITHIDLNKTNEAFETDLREASYGLPLQTKK